MWTLPTFVLMWGQLPEKDRDEPELTIDITEQQRKTLP